MNKDNYNEAKRFFEHVRKHKGALVSTERQKAELERLGYKYLGTIDAVLTKEQEPLIDYVVCLALKDAGPELLAMPDQGRAPCSVCGETVIFRPHAPQKPPKLCIKCAYIRAEEDEQKETN